MNRHSIFRAIIAVCFVWLVPCISIQSQAADAVAPGKVVGVAFIARTVADLDRSVAFYKALGFGADPSAATAWRTDPVIEQLYGVRGIETRTAKMIIVNHASGKPFVLYLRQVRGIERRNLAGHPAWEPGATHFSLVVADAPQLWSRLQAAGMLRARTWGSRLIAPPGQTVGRIGYITDPDGLDIELLNQRPAAPAAGGRGADPDVLPGVGHAGIVVLDSVKARAFYGHLLGGDLQKTDGAWLKGDFFDSVVGGHGNIMRVFDESFPEAAATGSRLNVALIEFQNRKQPVAAYRITDIGVGYVGFEVAGLEALLEQIRAGGAEVISRPQPVTARNGERQVLVRDPDVGGFIELFEK